MFAYQELKKFINKVSPSDQSRLTFLLYFTFYFYEAETLFSSVKVSFRFRLLRVVLPWVNCAVLKGQAKNFSFFVPCVYFHCIHPQELGLADDQPTQCDYSLSYGSLRDSTDEWEQVEALKAAAECSCEIGLSKVGRHLHVQSHIMSEQF